MAIDRTHWHMIRQAKVTGKALSAGYPDLLITAADMPKVDDAIGLPVRADTRKAQALHGWREPIVDSAKAFQVIGLELDVIDRVALQGSERIVDLNEPLDLGQYDIVIDPGTSEHCFNIPTAFTNLASAVKVGGVMSQALPMAMFNHGYWNVNPVALIDFYELNGFVVEKMVIRSPEGVFEPGIEDRRKRLMGVPDGAVNIITARRVEIKPFAWPQQKINT